MLFPQFIDLECTRFQSGLTPSCSERPNDLRTYTDEHICSSHSEVNDNEEKDDLTILRLGAGAAEKNAEKNPSTATNSSDEVVSTSLLRKLW